MIEWRIVCRKLWRQVERTVRNTKTTEEIVQESVDVIIAETEEDSVEESEEDSF